MLHGDHHRHRRLDRDRRSGFHLRHLTAYSLDGHKVWSDLYANGAVVEEDGFSRSGTLSVQIVHYDRAGDAVSHFDASGQLTDTTRFDSSGALEWTLGRDATTGVYAITTSQDKVVVPAIAGDGSISLSGVNTTVILPASIGNTTVNEFMASGAGQDLVQIDHTLAADYTHLLADGHDVGSDVVFTFSPSASLTLHNLHLAQLSAADFTFV